MNTWVKNPTTGCVAKSGVHVRPESVFIFAGMRSKQGLTATQALTLLFQGKNPEFMGEDKTQCG